MVESTGGESIPVGHLNEVLRDCDGGAELLFHEVGHFREVNFVDFDECGQLVGHVIQFLVDSPEVIFV